MSESINKIEGPPSDVSLMLRAHAELRCLSHEVIPVLRQVESRDGLPDEQLAAMAYLEVSWLEARRRAAETDSTHRELAAAAASAERPHETRDRALYSGACRYYDAVKALRSAVCRRVTPVLSACEQWPTALIEADSYSL